MSTAPRLPVLIAGAKAHLDGLVPGFLRWFGLLLTDRVGRCRLAAAGLWGFVNLPAAVVMIRSAAGGPSHPLSSFGAACLGFVFSAMGLTASGLWCGVEASTDDRNQIYWRKTWRIFLSTFPLAILWDTSVPPQSPFAAAVVITLALLVGTVAGIGSWWDLISLLPALDLPNSEASPLPAAVATASPLELPLANTGAGLLGDIAEEDLEEAEDETEAEALSQWQKRTLAEGQEVVEGIAIARFRSGEKQLQLHVAFCPPLEKAPQVEHFLPDGIPARSKVAACYSYGVRLELRRSSDIAEELEFPVHYRAWVEQATAGSAA